VLGQWIGNFSSKYQGWVVANVDEFALNYGGVAILHPNDTKIPAVAIAFKTTDKASQFRLTTNAVVAIDPRNDLASDWESIKSLYPDYAMPTEVSISGLFTDTEMKATAVTNGGLEIIANLEKKPFTTDSDIQGTSLSWDAFKKHVSSLEGRRNLFRGQNRPWKLRTAFHRRRRYDLGRFLNEDIPALYRYVTAKTQHVFNLQIPDQNGAFFNLVQHHGYPTPLLDWTYSPYVAAFFAFRGIDKLTNQADPVRVYVFDHSSWRADWQQITMLNTAGLHLSLLEFLAIENERAIPQQSVSTVTNIDDVEAYILIKEDQRKKKYLTAIDIPVSERNRAMEELSYMGITGASMFPGLDGICEELKERHFTH